MKLRISRRVLAALVVPAIAAVTVAGCDFTPDSNNFERNGVVGIAGPFHLDDFADYLASYGGAFPSETVPVAAELKVIRDGTCLSVMVDGVERFPVWPDDTKIYLSYGDGKDIFKVTLPGGTVLRPLRTKLLAFTAQAYVDYDQTFFGADPEKLVFADSQESDTVAEDWAPINMIMEGCGLEKAGVIVFPDAASIKADDVS